MDTIEAKLDRWADEMKAQEYTDNDVFFAISMKFRAMGDAALVEEARHTFGPKAADELEAQLREKRRAYRADCLILS